MGTCLQSKGNLAAATRTPHPPTTILCQQALGGLPTQRHPHHSETWAGQSCAGQIQVTQLQLMRTSYPEDVFLLWLSIFWFLSPTPLMPFPGCRRGNMDVPLPSPSLPLLLSQLGVSALTDAHCNQLPRPSTEPISDGTGVDKRQVCSLPQMTSHTGELSSGLRFVIFVCAHAWCVACVERPETTVCSQCPHSTFTGAEGMVPGLDSKCL